MRTDAGTINAGAPESRFRGTNAFNTTGDLMATATTGITVATSISTEGSSGTNANLPPYFALAFIMKL
jgi:hypothetical protein